MKNNPSVQKITPKNNNQTNYPTKTTMNSPKNISNASKKLFKVNTNPNIIIERPLTSEGKYKQGKIISYPRRKNSSKKLHGNIDDSQTTNTHHNNDQLRKLSEKLKILERKINNMKAQKKKQSVSQRSHTHKKDKSIGINKSGLLSIKQPPIQPQQKIIKQQKLKKSYVNHKFSYKNKNFNSAKNLHIPYIKNKYKQTQMSEAEDNLLHKFVTQVPKTTKSSLKNNNKYQQPNLSKNSLKSSVYDSLKNNNQTQLYKKKVYYIEHAIQSLNNPSLHSVRQHIVQSIQTLKFLQKIRKPSHKQLEKHFLSLPECTKPYCIVLDLDQTLIHCNQTTQIKHDVKLNIKFPTGEKIQAGVNIRPHVKQFLKQLSTLAQIIIFTASHQCYANVVLNHIDPNNQYITHRLFRQHCWQTEQGIYIKDLRVLGNRCLKNTLLVDNAAYSYFYQLQNGVPIIPYYDDKYDYELINLLEFIKKLILKHRNQNITLHKSSQQFFKLHQYTKFQDMEMLIKNLYQNTLLSFKNELYY